MIEQKTRRRRIIMDEGDMMQACQQWAERYCVGNISTHLVLPANLPVRTEFEVVDVLEQRQV